MNTVTFVLIFYKPHFLMLLSITFVVLYFLNYIDRSRNITSTKVVWRVLCKYSQNIFLCLQDCISLFNVCLLFISKLSLLNRNNVSLFLSYNSLYLFKVLLFYYCFTDVYIITVYIKSLETFHFNYLLHDWNHIRKKNHNSS